MHHVFVDAPLVRGENAVISKEDLHHAKDVLRLASGESVTLVDPSGATSVGIVSTGEGFSIVSGEVIQKSSRAECEITLLMGLAKGDKFEFVVQKAVELGASAIIPVAFSRSVTRIKSKDDEAKKLERWNKISRSAAMQSGRTFVPKVLPPMSVTQLCGFVSETPTLLAWELEKKRSISDALKSVGQGMPEHLAVIVGPEGGISEAEAAVLTEAGAISVSLGTRILRCETAPIALLAVIQYLTGGMAPPESEDTL